MNIFPPEHYIREALLNILTALFVSNNAKIAMHVYFHWDQGRRKGFNSAPRPEAWHQKLMQAPADNLGAWKGSSPALVPLPGTGSAVSVPPGTYASSCHGQLLNPSSWSHLHSCNPSQIGGPE